MEAERYEVTLQLHAEAKAGDQIAFVVELTYGGVFGLINVPQDSLQPLLLIECPRLLFPFARRVIADATGRRLSAAADRPIDFVICIACASSRPRRRVRRKGADRQPAGRRRRRPDLSRPRRPEAGRWPAARCRAPAAPARPCRPRYRVRALGRANLCATIWSTSAMKGSHTVQIDQDDRLVDSRAGAASSHRAARPKCRARPAGSRTRQRDRSSGACARTCRGW